MTNVSQNFLLTARTPEQLQSIRDEVLNDPAERGYAQYWPDAPGMIVELMNDKAGGQMYRSRYVTAREVIKLANGVGISVLGKFDAIEQSNIAVKWAVKFLDSEKGLDIGDPFTHAMIDQLISANTLTADEGAALKAMSMLPASRAEILGLGYLSEQDLRDAFAEE